MAYRIEGDELVIDGFEKGIAASPYQGIGSMINVSTGWYPGVAYVNYRRQATTLSSTTSTIALDTSAYLGSTGSATLTASYTCSGTNRLLFIQTNQNSTGGNNSVITNVIYGSQQLTKLTDAIDSNGKGQTLWYILNPATGSNTVKVISQYLGVPDVSGASNTVTTNTISLTLTTTVANEWIVYWTYADNYPITPTGFSVREDSGVGYTLGDTNGTVSAGAHAASFTNGSLAHGALLGLSLVPKSGSVIAFDSGQHSTPGTATTTFSHTCTGSNLILIVGVAVNSSSGQTMYGVTYNGIPLTQAVAEPATSSTTLYNYIYYLINPPTGTNTVSIVTGGTINACAATSYTGCNTVTTYVQANAISYNGVSEGFFPDNQTKVVTIPESSQSLSLTTVGDNCWALLAVLANPNTTATAGGGTTIRQDNTVNSNELIIADSNALIHPAGSKTLTVNFSGSVTDTTAILVSFAPYNTQTMANPVQSATSPAGLNYILDTNGNVWKQSAVNSSTFSVITNGGGRYSMGNAGLAYWNNYIVVIGTNTIEFCGDGTGDSTITSANWNLVNNSGLQTFLVTPNISSSQLSAQIANFTNLYVNDPVVFSTTGSMPAPLVAGQVYYIQSISDIGADFIFQVSLTPNGSAVTLTSAGTGTLTMTDLQTPFPLGNYTNIVTPTDITFTYPISSTTTTATLVGYTFPNGTVSPDGTWRGASGTYVLLSPVGDKIFVAMTYGSNVITFVSPPQYLPTSGTYAINLIDPTFSSHRAYVSKADGNLYFANGRYMGRIIAQNTTTSFNPSAVNTYTVDYGAFSILQQSDSIVDMTDLSSTLIVAGQKDIYTWDYISPSTSAPVPIGETIVRIKNLLNNIYVTAGQKGNLYVSNGSYAQFLFKIPDYIVGIIDPVWTFGGIMTHRGRIYFQASAQDTSGNNKIGGTFSLLVSPSLLGETVSGIVMESQNSNGLMPATGSTGAGILIDDEPSSSGQDSYYSVYSTGSSIGAVDYNDTTLWQNFEPTIQTDIINIGPILDKKTFGNIYFKLDRPMLTGDQIRLYARASLSDSWTLLGITTTQQLSDYYPSNLFQQQWAQFQIQFKAASSGSSFIPLREVRLKMVENE